MKTLEIRRIILDDVNLKAREEAVLYIMQAMAQMLLNDLMDEDTERRDITLVFKATIEDEDEAWRSTIIHDNLL